MSPLSFRPLQRYPNTQGDLLQPKRHFPRHSVPFLRYPKRLVIELEFESFVIFLVHLSLKYRHRQYQLADLYSMFAQARKPVIVAGDFNVFWGDRELDLFLTASGLMNANTEGQSTYPSWAPRRHLDFILHSPTIKVTNFFIPQVQFSDHMPLVCDFQIADDSAVEGEK